MREKTDAEKRYRAVRAAGASSSINREAWNAIVDKAKRLAREDADRFRAHIGGAEYKTFSGEMYEREICAPGQVPIDYQMVLNLEASMAETERVVQELEQLSASEDVSEALRQKLTRTLLRARESLSVRIANERRAHLGVIDGGSDQ